MSRPGGPVAAAVKFLGVTRSPGTLGWLDWAIGLLVHASMVMSCLCIATIIVLGVADITGRTLFNAPVMGTVEITEAMLAMTIFLALAYALEQHQHIVVDVITQGLGPRWRIALHFAALLAMLAVLVLLSWQSILSAERAWRVNEVAAGYLPVPVWLTKALSTAGLCITGLEALRQVLWLVVRWDLSAGSRRKPHASDEAPGEV